MMCAHGVRHVKKGVMEVVVVSSVLDRAVLAVVMTSPRSVPSRLLFGGAPGFVLGVGQLLGHCSRE